MTDGQVANKIIKLKKFRVARDCVRMRRMRIILSNHVRRQLNSVSLKVDEQ